MSDSLGTAIRLVTLLYVPAIILAPFLIAALMPNRNTQDADRAIVRLRLLLLAFMTLIALGIWLGLTVAAVQFRSETWRVLAQFSWVLFFPLWFLFGISAVRAKNPLWMNPGGQQEGVRTASITNRERENPIRPAFWFIAIFINTGLLAGIAARYLQPFSDTLYSGQGHLERTRWLVMLGAHAVGVLSSVAIMPILIRRSHAEPEPLDAAGSPELTELYRAHRRQKLWGMFWLLGVGIPVFMGVVLCSLTWWPNAGGLIGLVGAFGGSAGGIGGAIFGCRMAMQRMRIAEMKARLDEPKIVPEISGAAAH
jgi:hypothetical protein